MSQKSLNQASSTGAPDTGLEENLILETVIQAKKGDEKAFGKLYEHYFAQIYRFIYFRVNHKETAEDLTEDVFIKAWKRISDVNSPLFGGWLYSICKNTIIDYYRQKKIVVDIDEIEGTFESEQNIFEEVNFALDQKILASLLQKLPSDYQTILRLKFIEDLSNTEIAGLLGKTEGSIRVTQHRAIQKLQELHNQKFNSERKNAEI